MSHQLYLQCVAMSGLVWSTVQDLSIYFAQRLPIEIGSFEWVVDAKDPTRVSTQEKWWRETLGPLLEARCRRGDAPKLVRGDEFNYRYFKKAFQYTSTWWWPDRPRQQIVGYDIRKMISDRVAFADSRSDILLQAVDIFASFLRRALVGELKEEAAIRALGRLQLLRRVDGRLQCLDFLSISDKVLRSPQLVRTLKIISAAGRPMMRGRQKSLQPRQGINCPKVRGDRASKSRTHDGWLIPFKA